jgi:hypothetical protein
LRVHSADVGVLLVVDVLVFVLVGLVLVEASARKEREPDLPLLALPPLLELPLLPLLLSLLVGLLLSTDVDSVLESVAVARLPAAGFEVAGSSEAGSLRVRLTDAAAVNLPTSGCDEAAPSARLIRTEFAQWAAVAAASAAAAAAAGAEAAAAAGTAAGTAARTAAGTAAGAEAVAVVRAALAA